MLLGFVSGKGNRNFTASPSLVAADAGETATCRPGRPEEPAHRSTLAADDDAATASRLASSDEYVRTSVGTCAHRVTGELEGSSGDVSMHFAVWCDSCGGDWRRRAATRLTI